MFNEMLIGVDSKIVDYSLKTFSMTASAANDLRKSSVLKVALNAIKLVAALIADLVLFIPTKVVNLSLSLKPSQKEIEAFSEFNKNGMERVAREEKAIEQAKPKYTQKEPVTSYRSVPWG